MNRIARCLFFGTLLSFTLIVSGCGSGVPTGYVSGNVTLSNGNDPADLLVRFMNTSAGVGATAVVQQDGTYELKYKGKTGVPIGKFKIAVTAHIRHMNDLEVAEFMELSGAEQQKIKAERQKKRDLIPKKYQKTETSDLSYEIVDGVQTYNIVIPE